MRTKNKMLWAIVCDYKTFGVFFLIQFYISKTLPDILQICCIIAVLEGRLEIGHDSCDAPSIYTVPARYAHQCTNTNKDLPSVATSRKSLLPPVKLHTPWIWMNSYAMCLLMNVILSSISWSSFSTSFHVICCTYCFNKVIEHASYF